MLIDKIMVTVQLHKRWFYWPACSIAYALYFLGLINAERMASIVVGSMRIEIKHAD